MAKAGKRVVIIGAGIVGVSTAIWLQREGCRVTLIDKLGPAGGASYGNAGLLATASVLPVTVPGLLKKIPTMLLNPDSPLFLRWRYLPQLMPWLVRYLAHCNEKDVRRTAASLTYLVNDTIEQHRQLAKGTGAEKWIKLTDYFYAYPGEKYFEQERKDWELRRANGFEYEVLDGPQFRRFEPDFGENIQCAVRLKGHAIIRDPGAYVKALAEHVVANGGEFVQAEASGVVKQGHRVVAVKTDEGEIACDYLVLSAGAWSGPLAKALGVKLRLESERGYHVEFYNPSVMPNNPVAIATGKFLATPMQGRLRCAGLVEYGGLHAKPGRAPVALIKRRIMEAMPELSWERTEEWLGHRPATIDSLPVIGPARATPNAFLAFGHQHIGLTAGPKTGRLIADMITGRKTNVDLAAFDADRFVTGKVKQ